MDCPGLWRSGANIDRFGWYGIARVRGPGYRTTEITESPNMKIAVIGAGAIFIGVNALDYSGYPDCRPEYIEAFQQLVDVATKAGVEGRKITLEAPLIHMSKAEIIRAGTELGVDYADTLSCYQADEQGLACGQCDSCRLRREGFAAAGIADPTRYRPA